MKTPLEYSALLLTIDREATATRVVRTVQADRGAGVLRRNHLLSGVFLRKFQDPVPAMTQAP